MAMFEYGDIVGPSYRHHLPGILRGMVVKVNAQSVRVRWVKPDPPVMMWHNHGFISSDQLPDEKRYSNQRIILYERKGGPW